MSKIYLLVFIIFGCVCNSISQTTPLISQGSNWKYLDNGSNQGTAWYGTSFNDASWASGNAELGYGDGDEATVVSYGPSSSNKYITTYFRKQFSVTNPSQFFSIDLQARRDDGIVVYINGVEVWRDNMPAGNIAFNTVAVSTIAFSAESAWNQVLISPLYLNNGLNTIAVEIHQENNSSSDITMDLKMSGNLSIPNVNVTRGPYLNLGTSNSMIVKWRTDILCDSKIWYGTSITSLTNQASSPSFVTDHEIKILGLNPATVYYYMIGTSSATLTPASTNQFFKTSPVAGTKGKYKFWVVGDAGTGSSSQTSAKTGFLNYIGNTHVDGWLWLGDNAYDGGYDSEYQTNVFANGIYASELKKIVVWPAPGNHDYNNNIPFSPSPAYLDIFTLPTLGEAGGLASGTEKYYSYNYGNIHFIVLDSYSVGRNTNDPMATWLQNDLTANALPWVIAYWHHPPYTKGSHNSDNSNFLDGELVDMRQNILPILENGGVDLVLNGHSHCYERSFLIDSHYGSSGQFNASMIKNNTSGSYPSVCPYQKQTLINKAHKGTVYSVVGCSGKTSGTSSGWPHPVFYSYNNTLLGSMLIEVNDNRLDAKFITSTNSVYDGFTIVKNAGKKVTLNICQGQNAILKPSWPEPVYWFPLGTTLDSAIVTPAFSTIYYAYDPNSCIKDTFVVNVTPNTIPPCNITSLPAYEPALEVSVYPTLIKSKNEAFVIRTLSRTKIESTKILDIQGKIIEAFVDEISDTELKVNFKNETPNGVYFLELIIDNKPIHKKIIFNK
jgi:hypothetical protein